MIKRSAGKNPYPGVSRNKDRHGRARWRVRLKGLPQTYLPGEYGSAELRAAYKQVVNGERTKKAEPAPRHLHGTFNWLIEQYKQTPTWEKMAPFSLRNLQYDLDRFS